MPIKSFHTILSFFVLLILFLSLKISAQDFLIKKYSVDNGLPDNRVNDIVQDSNGIIWIATKTGIASYDGVEWIRYGSKDGVPEVEFIRIKIDDEGTIWFLPKYFSDNAIFYFKNSRWDQFKVASQITDHISSLVSIDVKNYDNKVEIAVGTLTSGILIYQNDNWKRLTRKDGLLSDTLTQLIYLDNKLVVSSLKGLSYLDQDNKVTNLTFDKFGVNSRILAMRKSKVIDLKKSKLLLLSLDWMGELVDGRLNILSKKFNIPFVGINDLNCINYNSAGDIIWGNPARVYYYNKTDNTTSQIVIEEPESNKGINSILVDYEENIWLAGFRGVYKYRLSNFKNYYKKDGLLENEVTAISEFNSGKLVLGHNYGISVMEPGGFKAIAFSKPVTDSRLVRVIDIFHESKSDNIYTCSYTNGIGIIDKNYRIKWIKFPYSNLYFSLFIDTKNNILVTTENGIYKLNSKNNFIKISPEIKSMVRKGLFIRDSLAYLISSRGLFKWDNFNYINYSTSDSDADDLFSIYYDDKYGLLVGSVKGLYKLEDDKLLKFNFNEQEINESVYFIIKDKKEHIWLGTNNGILRWDGKKITRFNKSDGLSGNETNRAAGFVDSKGNFWIGTDEGLSLYIDKETDYSKISPKLVLSKIQDDNNENFSASEDLTFNPSNNSLTFVYRGLSFIDEAQNVYEVQLSNIEGDWSEKFQTAYPYSKFINLSPGEYRFSVRYKNSKGIWSDWKHSSVITINKHFYQQPLFILGSILVSLFLLYHLYNFLQQRKYTQKLELAVETRTQELKKNQTELMTSMNRYKGIVDSQTDLVIRVDPHGNFTFVNDAFCKLFGISRESIIGTSLFSFIHPDDLPRAIEEAKKLNSPPNRIKMELRSVTTNGIRWFSWEDYAFFDENKKLVEVQGVGRDITIQKEIETELERRVRERTSELQSLIQQSPLGILTFDSDGYLIDFNDSANKLFGNLSDFLSPNRLFNIFEDEFLLQNNYKGRLKELQSSNSQLITNRIHINNSANTIYTNLYSHYLIYRLYSVGFENQKNIIVLLLEDVTDLQKSEENAKRLSEEKLRITTIIKTIEAERERISKELHDGVGQMLTSAKIKLDIFNLKSESDKKEVSETINILIDAGDEIRRIINDLKPSDVENFGLASAIEMLCKRIQEISGIKTHCNIKEVVRFKEKTDEVVVYRIIQEAFNNIIKHSKCKNAGIDFIPEVGFVKINIWDDGIGFSEVDNVGKSVGFGIQNMLSRAKLIGAEIKIIPSDKGTTVSIKIPV